MMKNPASRINRIAALLLIFLFIVAARVDYHTGYMLDELAAVVAEPGFDLTDADPEPGEPSRFLSDIPRELVAGNSKSPPHATREARATHCNSKPAIASVTRSLEMASSWRANRSGMTRKVKSRL
jgi:hypothetical protein